MSATITHTETYDVFGHGAAIAELALPGELEARLRAALDIDEDHRVEWAINEAVTARIQEHGVDTATGEWLGTWSAEDVVADILARHGV